MIEEEEHTGRPRPREDVEAALACITREIVTNPLVMSKTGEPLVIHYLVIREILQAYLAALP